MLKYKNNRMISKNKNKFHNINKVLSKSSKLKSDKCLYISRRKLSGKLLYHYTS